MFTKLNKIVVVVLVVLVFGLTTEAFSSTSPELLYKTYVVQKGDVLWKIAKRFLGDGMKYKLLAKWSGIANAHRINPGQVIRLSPKPIISAPDYNRRTLEVMMERVHKIRPTTKKRLTEEFMFEIYVDPNNYASIFGAMKYLEAIKEVVEAASFYKLVETIHDVAMGIDINKMGWLEGYSESEKRRELAFLVQSIIEKETEYRNVNGKFKEQGPAQFMVSTARRTAKKHGLEFKKEWLRTNMEYTVTLICLHLQDLYHYYGRNRRAMVMRYNNHPELMGLYADQVTKKFNQLMKKAGA